MVTRLALVLVVCCTACQSGLIPCPKVKSIRSRHVTMDKAFHESSTSYSSNARMHSRYSRGSDDRMIQNISVEEWDCPRPGQKKYMPRSIRENIKRNLKRVEAKDQRADSLSIQ